MKRLAAALASLVVHVVPASVAADEATAPTAAPPPVARWSLAGGIAFESLGLLSSGTSSSLLASQFIVIPGPTGTLERRITDLSWAFFHVSGAVDRRRSDVAPGSYGFTRFDQRSLTASVGVRRALTGRGAPVEVSTLAGLHGGITDAEEHLASFTASTRIDRTTWFAGASFGLALHRELTHGLALRLSTPLLFGTYSEGSNRVPGQPRFTTTGLTIAATIAPQLELAVFF